MAQTALGFCLRTSDPEDRKALYLLAREVLQHEIETFEACTDRKPSLDELIEFMPGMHTQFS